MVATNNNERSETMTNVITVKKLSGQKIDTDITVGFDLEWPCNNWGVYQTMTRTVWNIHVDSDGDECGFIKFGGAIVKVSKLSDNWDTDCVVDTMDIEA
jgi:hypothetical protein